MCVCVYMYVCLVWGWAQAELQSDHTRFHKLKFKIFIFCDIQFRSARVY